MLHQEGVLKVVQFNGFIYIYIRRTLNCCHGNKNFGIFTQNAA